MPSTQESPDRIEPTRLENPTEDVSNAVADVSAASARLATALHPKTAANLANLLRVMNCYFSNLIEGHNTQPRDIARALAGDFDADEPRRNLQLEARAHIRVQAQLDNLHLGGRLPEPASTDFLLWLHREFYRDVSDAMLRIEGAGRNLLMVPGSWRSRPEHDVAVGRHLPPSSVAVVAFMARFEDAYRLEPLVTAARIAAIAAAHHRLNFIHPFPDGNGRVSRLMSHAMGLKAGIGAFGLWSISRGLARGLESRGEYKRMMDHADMPRQGDLDGRGHLSTRALREFTVWFLKVCLDQINFMTTLFDLNALSGRLRKYVAHQTDLPPEAADLLEEALRRGEFERGAAQRITGLKERTARDLLGKVIDKGLLASDTPKSAVSLRFPAETVEPLFPRLYPET